MLMIPIITILESILKYQWHFSPVAVGLFFHRVDISRPVSRGGQESHWNDDKLPFRIDGSRARMSVKYIQEQTNYIIYNGTNGSANLSRHKNEQQMKAKNIILGSSISVIIFIISLFQHRFMIQTKTYRNCSTTNLHNFTVFTEVLVYLTMYTDFATLTSYLSTPFLIITHNTISHHVIQIILPLWRLGMSYKHSFHRQLSLD